jgi:arylsulfatase A-like enzyme
MKHNAVLSLKLRRTLRAVPLVAGALLLHGATKAADRSSAERKPNVLIIVADDLGYADLGFQGCKDIPTPHIDELAAGGVRFTNGYVSCPVCSPTRAGIMTGRYQQRFGHEFNPGPLREDRAGAFGLPTSEVTLANVMKSAGYATGIVGKWHLGFAQPYRPLQRGFDEFFGFLGGAHTYLDPSAQEDQPIYRGDGPVEEHGYLTDAFAREAVAFIERHKQEPFLLFLTFNAVHNPLQATENYLARFASIADPKRKTYAAMLSAMDDAVGRVLGALRGSNLEDDTLIFFVSDNGGPTQANSSRNDPLSGVKGTAFEGGIRVPFVMQWKRRLPQGKVYEQPVISLDLFATAAAAGGASLPKDRTIDGVDLVPFVAGQQPAPPHSVLYWRFGAWQAIRKGNYKLVRQEGEPDRLFDLAADIGEKNDLARAKPDVAKELSALYAQWNSELAQPLWQTQRRAAQRAPRRTNRGRANAAPAAS